MFQLLWIPATWFMAMAMTRSRRVAALVVAALGFTGSVFVNSIYAWPKLAAASFLLVAFALLVVSPPDFIDQIGATKFRFALVGLACGLAVSSHGSVAFAVVGLAPAMLVVVWHRSRPGGRSALVRGARDLGIAGGVLFLTYLPWLLYSPLRNESGDLLLKMHLAGHPARGGGSTLDVIRDAYSHISFGDWLHARWENVTELLPYGGYRSTATGFWGKVQLLHTNEAYRIGGALLWAIPWVVLWCFARRRRASGEATRIGVQFLPMLAIWSAATLAVWVLVMFQAGATDANAGPLTLVVVPMVIAVSLLAVRQPRLAVRLLVVQATLFTLGTVAPPINKASVQIHAGALAVVLAGLAAIALSMISLATTDRATPEDAEGATWARATDLASALVAHDGEPGGRPRSWRSKEFPSR